MEFILWLKLFFNFVWITLNETLWGFRIFFFNFITRIFFFYKISDVVAVSLIQVTTLPTESLQGVRPIGNTSHRAGLNRNINNNTEYNLRTETHRQLKNEANYLISIISKVLLLVSKVYMIFLQAYSEFWNGSFIFFS